MYGMKDIDDHKCNDKMEYDKPIRVNFSLISRAYELPHPLDFCKINHLLNLNRKLKTPVPNYYPRNPVTLKYPLRNMPRMRKL